MGRVLNALAHRNPDMGYCQGLNFIVSFLFGFGFTEEESFYLMVLLVEECLGNHYFKSMLPAMADVRILSLFLAVQNPQLFKHLQDLGADLNLIILPYLIVCFSNSKN